MKTKLIKVSIHNNSYFYQYLQISLIMKFFRFLLVAFVGITVVFSACKKNDIFTDRLSVGSLKDSSGNCLPSSVHGEYSSGTTLLVEHYIDVYVNVDTVGAYSIATDSTNGYSFKGTGTFGIKGDNLVRLYGHGTPLFGGVNIFTVRYGSSACRVAVTVSGTAAVPAIFTLDTLAGACPGVVLEGTFSSNIPATALNKAKLGVVVTTPGTYSITTTAINGISFSGTGAFTTAGPQTLVLTANGTPTVSGAFNYTATVNGVSCTYSVTVAEGPSAAVFTLGGSPSTCTGFVLGGTYQAGTLLNSSNTVTCQVNVTTAGAYSLSTNIVNGTVFSGAGTFTTTGAQTIVLTAMGMPISAGINSFTVSAAGGNCTFSVTTVAGSGPVSDDFYFKATINSKSISYILNSPPNIIGGVTESRSGPPLTGPYFYWEGFAISDFDKRDTNEIDVSIGKFFTLEPTTSDLVGMFHLGAYNYGPAGTTAASDGAFVTYTDENGEVWTSSTGSQTGSTFSITELVDDPSGSVKKIFTAKFSCKLYNTITSASINLVNGEIRGGVVSP